MKDLDIESLERKMPYAAPESFFSRVQENVLRETINKKQKSIGNLNWIYAAAAAVAMIFGITFFVNYGKDTAPAIASADKVTTENNYRNSQSTAATVVDNSKPATQEKIAYQTLTQDLTSVENANQTVTKEVENPVRQNVAASVNSNPETDVDQLLANFSTEELKAISKNSEQDVYLDLYN